MIPDDTWVISHNIWAITDDTLVITADTWVIPDDSWVISADTRDEVYPMIPGSYLLIPG